MQSGSAFGGVGVYQGTIAPGNPNSTSALSPNADRLGTPGYGFGNLTMDYSQAAAPGNTTINKPVGQVQIAVGQKAVTVTNSLVTINSHINVTLNTVDATLTEVKNVVLAAGSFTINCDVNATGTVKLTFQVVGTDT